jgi:hypothetical protein
MRMTAMKMPARGRASDWGLPAAVWVDAVVAMVLACESVRVWV